jgi:hypothetical protein
VLESGEFCPGEPYVFFEDPDGSQVEVWYELPTRVHALTARANSIRERIARGYVLRFRQAAVLRVKMPASVSLIRNP